MYSVHPRKLTDGNYFVIMFALFSSAHIILTFSTIMRDIKYQIYSVGINHCGHVFMKFLHVLTAYLEKETRG